MEDKPYILYGIVVSTFLGLKPVMLERDCMVRTLSACPFKTGAEVSFHNKILGNFMVYQDQIETNLLQLFGHPEN